MMPAAGHGSQCDRLLNQCPSRIKIMTRGLPPGSDPKTVLDLDSRQLGSEIEKMIGLLQNNNRQNKFIKHQCQNTSRTHTVHARPKPAPRQKIVTRHRKPVPLPRKSRCIGERQSSQSRNVHSSAVNKSSVSSRGYEQCASGAGTLRFTRQLSGVKPKPPVKPRKGRPPRHRFDSVRTVDFATQTSTTYSTDETIDVTLKEVSRSSYDEIAVNGIDVHCESLSSSEHRPPMGQSGDGHRRIEKPMPRSRKLFDGSHSCDNGRGYDSTEMTSPMKAGNGTVDEDWIDEPLFEEEEPVTSHLISHHRNYPQAHNERYGVGGGRNQQRAGSLVCQSSVGRMFQMEVHKTSQPPDVDSDEGQWETDSCSSDDVTGYDMMEPASQLTSTHHESLVTHRSRTGITRRGSGSSKDRNGYELFLPSYSSSRAPSGDKIPDNQTMSHRVVSRLQSSDSTDLNIPHRKQNSHRTVCSTDSNLSASSHDSLDATPSPPLPKREPKGLQAVKSTSKKHSALSQLVLVPGEKRKPGDSLPRPPPPPPHRGRKMTAVLRKHLISETDSEYDDWRSCDSGRNSAHILDTIIGAIERVSDPPPLPPRSAAGSENAQGDSERCAAGGENTPGDSETEPLFDKRKLEATLSVEIPYQSDWVTNDRSSAKSRDLYEDNISTTNDGEVQLNEDSEKRSRRSDTPSQAPSYLELISDDDPSVIPKTSRFDDEPLYQIYHQSIIARNFQGRNGSDTDSGSSSAPPSRTSSLLSPDGRNPVMTVAKKSMIQALLVGTGANTRRLWCDMSEVVNRGVLSMMPLSEKKMQETLFEIITSEASYLKSLHLVISHFVESVEFDAIHSPAAIVTKRDYKILFSNIVAVWTVSARFLALLERVWNQSCVLSPGQLCGLFSEYAARHFDVYISYCSNQMFQNRKLKELKNNTDFMDVLTRLEKHPRCNSLSMRSFLLLPVQRITRLPLLVDSVCHRMDTMDADYPVVMKCLHVLQKLVKQCNEGARNMHNLEEITRISHSLDFHNIRTIALVSQCRALVKQGQLTRILPSSPGILDKLTRRKEPLHLFLFNDLLLITRKRGESYQVTDTAPRIAIHADIIQEDQIVKYLPNGAPRGCRNLFMMVLLEKTAEYIFSCDSMSERTRWVEATTPSQQLNEDETIYETWDCPQVQVIESYEAKQPDELQLEESDVVKVSRKMADGWFEGERIRDGERGWFPSSCVVEIMGEHRRAKNMRQRYRLLHSLQV